MVGAVECYFAANLALNDDDVGSCWLRVGEGPAVRAKRRH
jgi:hypothetical protein